MPKPPNTSGSESPGLRFTLFPRTPDAGSLIKVMPIVSPDKGLANLFL